MRRHRGHFTLIAVSLAIGLVFFGLQQFGFWYAFDAKLQDKLLPDRTASSDIIIVAIDNKSIAAIGRWPWDRAEHAAMIDRLTAAGASVIGYDVTFSEPSTITNDDALAAAIRNSGKVVLAAEASLQPRFGRMPLAESPLLPLEKFRDGSAYGLTTLTPDADSIIRTAPVLMSTEDGQRMPIFADAIASRFGESNLEKLTDGAYSYRIPYVDRASSYATHSFSDVRNATVSPTTFKDKIVLIGSTAPDLHDEYPPPRSGGSYTPGVVIQANIIQGLMDGARIRRSDLPTSLAIHLLLSILIVTAASLLRLRYALGVTAIIMIGYTVALAVSGSRGLLLPAFHPYLAMAATAAAGIAHKYLDEKRRRTFIADAFSHYLSPKLIAKIVSGETKLELGGINAELTILFSDIRGFTTISEKLTPPELVSLLNEYLSAMTDIILDEGGTVDKYIGDAIMAFWGAPVAQADHASRAANAVLRMRDRLTELQAKWRAEGKPEVNIGVGLNTGTVVVGNMGSKQRFDYTVMGDDVNLASRLEGLTKQYKVTALITEATRLKLGDAYLSRPIDRVAVKGKSVPVQIHELLGRAADTEQHGREFIELFKKAQERYVARQWDDAKTIFDVLVHEYKDGASSVFSERCDYMKAHDPGEAWNGVFVAKEK